MVNLSELNPAQKEAVLKTDGPVMILAGAGSGKTRTLVTRIIYLLEEKMVSPFRVLALTFSNKAAREMRERVSASVNLDIGTLKLTTFHSFCANMLRAEASYLGLSRNFTIYDDTESKAVVKAILGKHGISTKEISPYEILNYMDGIKNSGHYIGRSHMSADIDPNDEYYPFYTEYEAELQKANAVDFGGLITGVIQLFEKFPEVLERYQKRFEYVLVDEYQDTNRAQFELMEMLCRERRNICAVGDEDQSIYSWRGADIRNILDFEKVFPEAHLIKLEQNYRSSKIIIEAASHVISNNEMRKGKDMWTDNDDGDIIRIVECQNDKKEAEYIASKVKKHAKDGAVYSDMAIFYRTNSQSRVIEDHLRSSNIPYRVIGGVKFYDRKEVKDLLSYVRLLVNEQDSLALSRIINVPTRGIGAVSLRKIEQEAIKNSTSLWNAIEDIVENPGNYSHIRLSAKVKSSLAQFADLIQEAKLMDQNGAKPSDIFEKLLHESGYWEHLRANGDYESQARMENLEELGSAFIQFESSSEKPSMLGFLETITLDNSVIAEEEENQGEVSLMTVHGAKGLEFPYVFVTGAEENIFPSFQSIDGGPDKIEEERRLFYVAMTRAMEKLYITFAQGRLLFGQVKFNGPSRFLHEIPSHYYTWERESKESYGYTKTQESWDEYSQDTDYDEPVYQVNRSIAEPTISSTYGSGDRIKHGIYGAGVVIRSDGSGPSEKVEIKFSDGSRKKFMVKFAPLTLL